MFVHAVYFWLRDDLSVDERRRFVSGVHDLLEIDSVRDGYVGVPAATDRPIIDRSYTYALTVVFDRKEDHDAYQVDAIHDRFREQCADLWTQVKIYDSVTE